MPQTDQLPAPLDSDRMFVGLFLAAYGLLLVDLLLSQGLAVAWPMVTVRAMESNRRIEIEWPGYSGLTTVEWLFVARPDDTTFVRITESGFRGSGDEVAKQVADSTQGFSLVLAGLKALLEHNVRLNLVADRVPEGLEDQE